MKSFLVALQFMTRIPLPISMEVSDKDFGRSQRAFVLVGFLIGGILSFTYFFLQYQVPPLLLAALLLVMEITVKGGLLLDGFMDTCDGLFSAKPRERALEIMKDSRVGAHSVTTVSLLFLVKFAVYSSLPMLPNPYLLLLLSPAFNMWFIHYLITFFPYARPEGVGKFFYEQREIGFFALATAFLALGAFWFSWPIQIFGAMVVSFLLMTSGAIRVSNFLGGHTGDTYGAFGETIQALFMVLLVVLFY